jgi:hypothetical protein
LGYRMQGINTEGTEHIERTEKMNRLPKTGSEKQDERCQSRDHKIDQFAPEAAVLVRATRLTVTGLVVLGREPVHVKIISRIVEHVDPLSVASVFSVLFRNNFRFARSFHHAGRVGIKKPKTKVVRRKGKP